jgi:UDP-N-acetylmuramoyl-tripeptide--D-alanyl-D-alanine ligase
MTIIQILIAFTILLFLSKVFSDACYYLWLLQVKEYRLDRMKSHIRENVRLNQSDLAIAVGFFILLSLLFPVTARFIFVSLFLLLGFIAPLYFLYGSARFMRDILRHRFLRPKPTQKIMLISATAFIFYGVFSYYLYASLSRSAVLIYSPDFYLIISALLLLLNLVVPIFILLSILAVNPVSAYQKRKIIARAKTKMHSMKHVRTIGITGSYGKTSTKEFLFTILSSKYKVAKTEGNNNTQMGVAGTVLARVSDELDFFICEMGAYRIGEIREISDIARPFAGIITGINEQHLDLFGSIGNTKRAKYELIQSLPADGFAIINDQTTEIKPHIRYSVKDVAFYTEDTAEDVRVNPEIIEFVYKKTTFKANILGKHYLGNLMAAILAAEKLGMTLEEISGAVSGISAKDEHLMRKLDGPHDSIFIDDSYSANPDGVIAALEYLADAYPDRKKILVFPGIIELGQDSAAIHEKIWDKASDICSFAFILQAPHEIKVGESECQFIFEKDFNKMKELVKKRIDKNSVLLFESRGAGVVMGKILENKKQ